MGRPLALVQDPKLKAAHCQPVFAYAVRWGVDRWLFSEARTATVEVGRKLGLSRDAAEAEAYAAWA